MPDDLVIGTERGLYCAAGDFYIDPWEPVDRAVITHAHADHARPGSKRYLCSTRGATLLRQRVQLDAAIDTLDWGQAIDHGGVRVSLHPSGHLLGSAQVRLEHRGRVWVVSGDYKAAPDITCEPFEPVRCDAFITESTFGLPIYRWPREAGVWDDLHAWWRGNQDAGRTSIVLAYALGKAQRVIARLDPAVGPIIVHGAVERFVNAYRDCGVAMPPVVRVTGDGGAALKELKGRAIVVAPPSALGTPWIRKFAPLSTAMASGWMRVRGRRRHRSLDRGFVMSDHADWPGLLAAIDATGAERIGITHGYTHALCRYLLEQGRDAFCIATRYEGDEGSTEVTPTG